MEKKYTLPPYTNTYLVDFSSPILPSSLYFKGTIFPHLDSSSLSSASSLSSSPSSSFLIPPPSSCILSPSSFHLTSSSLVSIPSSTKLLVKRIPSSFAFSRTNTPFSPSPFLFIEKNHFLHMLNSYFDDEKKELLLFYSLPNQLSFSKIVEEGLCTEGILYFFQQIVSLLFSLQKEEEKREREEEKEKRQQKEEKKEGKEKKKKEEEEKMKRNKKESWDFNPTNIFLSNYQIKACFYMQGEYDEIMISPESLYKNPADIDKEKEMIFISGLYFYYLIFAEIPFEKERKQFLGEKRINENGELKWKKKASAEEIKDSRKKVKSYSKEKVIKFYEQCLQELIEKIEKQIFFIFPKKQLIELLQKLLHPDPSKRYSKVNLLEDPIWQINENQNEREKERLEKGKIKFEKGKIERDTSIKLEKEEKDVEKSLKAEDEKRKERREGSILFNENLLKIFEREDKKVKKVRGGRNFVTKQAIETYEFILSEIKFCEISLRIIADLEKNTNNNNDSIILPLIYYTTKTAYDRLASLNHSLNKCIMNNQYEKKMGSSMLSKVKATSLLILSQIQILPVLLQKISSLLKLLSSQLNSITKILENSQKIDLKNVKVFGGTFKQDHFETLKIFFKEQRNWPTRLMDDLLILGAWEELNQSMDEPWMTNEKDKEKSNKKELMENNEKKEFKGGKYENSENIKEKQEKEEEGNNIKEEFKVEEEENEEEDDEKDNEQEKQSKVRMVEFYESLRGRKPEECEYKEENIKINVENNEKESMNSYWKREEELKMRVEFGIKKVFGEIYEKEEDKNDDEKEEQSKVRMVEFYEEIRERKPDECEYIEENIRINEKKKDENNIKEEFKVEEEENEKEDDENDDEKKEQSKVRMFEFYEEIRERKPDECEYIEENIRINEKKNDENNIKEEFKVEEEENEEENDENDDEQEEQSKVRMVEFYEEIRERKPDECEYLEENIKINVENNEIESRKDYWLTEEELNTKVELGNGKVFRDMYFKEDDENDDEKEEQSQVRLVESYDKLLWKSKKFKYKKVYIRIKEKNNEIISMEDYQRTEENILGESEKMGEEIY